MLILRLAYIQLLNTIKIKFKFLVMRNFFTKHFLLVVLTFVAADMLAQINTLKITAPAAIAGEYDVQRFNWGPIVSTSVTGEAKYGDDGTAPVNDGCTDLTNDLTGTIGFLDRGVCGLSDKAARIEKAGGIAAIICNTATGNAASAVGGGVPGLKLKINAYMMSDADCKKVRASILAGGVTAELIHKSVPCTITYEPEVFWGNVSGQGDFAGGLNGWTIENATPDLDTRTTWFWTESGFPRTARSFTDNNIKSVSQCNGAACMDLEALQFEDNESPTQPYNNYSSALVSPSIDCRGKTKINLQFRMFHNRLNGSASYALFDGTTWGDPVKIASKNTVNQNAVGETVVIAVPQFANKENCKVKFIVTGDFYTFVLDDVMLSEKEVVDSKINKDWYAVAPTVRVPASQVSPIHFMTDVSNIGNTDASNVNVDVLIENETGVEVAKLTKNYGSLAFGSTSQNGIFDDSFTPDATPQLYNAYYQISSSDNDADTTNNKASFLFEVTENTFSTLFSEAQVNSAYLKDIARIWAVTPTNYQSFGTIYYMPKGAGYTVDKVRFGLDNAVDEIESAGFIQVELYEWIDENNDLSVAPNERILVGANSVFLEGDVIANPRLIEMPIWGVDEGGNPVEDQQVQLKDDQNYVMIAHTRPLDPSFPRIKFLTYNGFGLENVIDRSVYFYPADYVLDSLGLNQRGGSVFAYEGVDESDEADRTYDLLGNTGTLFSLANMYLEMDIKKSNSTYNIAKTGSANVFPNPASRDLYVDITLDNTSDVKVELISVDGKVVMTKSFDGVKDSRLKLELNGVASGAYTAMIHTNTGVIAKKVVVQK